MSFGVPSNTATAVSSQGCLSRAELFVCVKSAKSGSKSIELLVARFAELRHPWGLRTGPIQEGSQPGPRLHQIWKSSEQKLYTFRPRTLRNVVGRRARRGWGTPAMRPQWPYYSVRRSSAHHLASSRGKFPLLQPLNSPVQCLLAGRWAA